MNCEYTNKENANFRNVGFSMLELQKSENLYILDQGPTQGAHQFTHTHKQNSVYFESRVYLMFGI